MRRLIANMCAMGLILAAPHALASVTITPGATEGSTTDLFNGAAIGTTSSILHGFVASSSFGGTHIAPDFTPETTTIGTRTIFDSDSGLKFINFSTAIPVTVAKFVASVSSDGVGNPFRGFSSIALLGSSDGGATYSSIASTLLNPAGGPQTVTFSFALITGQFFRFEGLDLNGGARIIELDGFGVPEPATWALMILGVGLAGAALRRRAGIPARA